MTTAVRNGAQAQADNRQKRRDYQAPVFAGSSCEKPRRDWKSDVLQSLFFAKRSDWRISEPQRKIHWRLWTAGVLARLCFPAIHLRMIAKQ
jgi:hypothetical protein